MKRVLIVTYYWPPTGGSGVQRWIKFAKYLPSEGWQPVILTPENPEQPAIDESLLKDIPPQAEVIKLPIREPYEIYRRLTGKKQGGGEVTPLNAQKKSFKQRVAVWIRGNLFIPDPRVGWVRPASKFLKKYLAEHPVDAIVTSGPPQSMHLIGLRVKKYFPGLRWIADFRDPWTKVFYFKHLGLSAASKRKQERLEKQVLDSADCILSVTPMVQEEFRTMTSTPVEMITNGYDPDDFREDAPAKSGKFIIAHTGFFASDGNPISLWEALGEKCSQDERFASALEIRLCGKIDRQVIDALKEKGLENNVSLLGYLPHNEISREQMGASILILPLRQEPELLKILPGKIFEYLAARRPVLGIGQSDGVSAWVIRDAKAGEMFEWEDKKGMAAFVDKYWEAFVKGEEEAFDSDIEKYSRPALTQKLTEIL